MTRYECARCEKSFSCGKGLGGHKRAHRSSKRERGNGGGDDQTSMALVPVPSGENSCPVCRQCFWSEKSLHGHMRKHPDRSWRGMVPPPVATAPPVDADADSLAVANNLLALANIPFNRFACDQCGRQFKSYQALGGHKSHHGLKAPRVVYMEQPEGFGRGGQGSGEGGRGRKAALLNLDLNELPPEELM